MLQEDEEAYCWDIFAPFYMHYVWMIRNQATKLRYLLTCHCATDSKLVKRILVVVLQTL